MCQGTSFLSKMKPKVNSSTKAMSAKVKPIALQLKCSKKLPGLHITNFKTYHSVLGYTLCPLLPYVAPGPFLDY